MFNYQKIIGCFLALLLVTSGLAQDYELDANYGFVQLSGGFLPDPHVIDDIEAGGSISLKIALNCEGYISDAPDIKLEYSDSTGVISFFVASAYDTVLLINDPSSDWYCNDDFSSGTFGFAPGVIFRDAESGIYDIWVGTYSEDDFLSEAQLIITEREELEELKDIMNIEPDFTSDELGSGTGFIVSQAGHILTNYHVVEGCTNQTFQLRGNEAVEAQLIGTNPATDLALLRADLEIEIEPAQFRDQRNIRLGDEVVVYGFPLSEDLSSQGNLTNGIVSALSGLDDDLSRIQMTAQIQPGNSGGPVMDRFGRVIGVVVESASDEFFREQRDTTMQNVNFAIRDALVRVFLDTNNIDYKATIRETEQSVADIAEMAQGFTGIILCYD